MKQPKRLTRQQKECLSAYHLNARNWALEKETEFYLYIVNKITGKKRTVDKHMRGRR